MAEANSNLNILVRVRDEASGALSRLSNDISDLGGSLNYAGDQAGTLASALAAVGATAVLKTAINAFAEGEAQMAKFNTIVKSLPPNLQELRGRILDVADNALIKFGFSNEDAAISMARLLQATRDGDFTFKAFQAAMDLARYKGISLEEATQALILSFQGGGKILKSFGIEVDDHASKETILAAVMQATAGQAEAYANTLKGQFELVGNLFDEFQKGVGAVFAPSIKAVIEALKAWIEANGGVEASVELLKPIMIGFAVLMGGVVVAGVIAAGVALASLSPIALAVGASIAALGAVLTLFVTLWRDNWEIAKLLFQAFSANVTSIWTIMVNNIKGVFGSAMNWIRDQLNSVVSFFQSVIAMVSNPIQNAQKGISDTYSKVAGSLKGVLGFAEGGIVTRPTLAMIGEGGEAEAVIPLSKLGGIGGGINIYLQGDFYSTTEVAEKFGNEMARVIKNQLSLSIRA